MNLKLPNKPNGESNELENVKNIVILGANGSGKTRLGSWIEKNNMQITHRIAAQKSLSFPMEIRPTTKEKAFETFAYGHSYDGATESWRYKLSNRWGSKPNTFLLDDYEKLLILLHTEEYEKSVKFKDEFKKGIREAPITKLDTIQQIWEEILPHRKLLKTAGKIEAFPVGREDKIYNSSNMSDGERLIFYFIGEIICCAKNSIVIIDEPENHLHKSIINKLWNKIENLRSDCVFIYMTHDIDFAISRTEYDMIWLKSYEGNEKWDYEKIEDVKNIPKEIYLEILGSRKNILFIEGEKDSLDYHVYQQIFNDYSVIPLGSCGKVVEATKSFNELNTFHNLDAKGIIDRDRKSHEELISYSCKQIYAPKVAEIENLFMTEEVIKIISVILRKNPEEVFSQVFYNIFKIFNDNLDKQAFEYATYKSNEIVRNILQSHQSARDFDSFVSGSKNEIKDFNFKEIFDDIKGEFEVINEKKDYKKLLEIFNFKGMIGISKVSGLCGLKKASEYTDFIKKVLKEDSDDGNSLRKSMGQYIKLD